MKSSVGISDPFTAFLFRQSQEIDEEIIRQIAPFDNWTGTVQTGSFATYHYDWFETRESVRKLSEGFAFIETEPEPPEYCFDRFNDVFPDLTKKWESQFGKVGKPLDPTNYYHP